MAEFHTSEIIGLRLRQQREARHVSLEQAAAALRIRLRYVEAMDKGEFDLFPSPAQARGFLRTYAQYLGLEAEPFLAALDGDPSLLEEADQEELNEPPSEAYTGDSASPAGEPPPDWETEPGLESETSPGGAGAAAAAVEASAGGRRAANTGASYPRS
jgi:transcriptional regulator with XRE-family HTH domain